MFTKIFEGILGQNTQHDYAGSVYTIAGLFCLITPFILSAIFYLVLNGQKSFNTFRKLKHWFIMMGINSALVGIVDILIAKAQLDTGIDAYMILFGLLNFGFSAGLFWVASYIFKKKSIHAKFIPN